MRHRCALLAALAVSAGVCACDDPGKPVVPPGSTPFPALTTRNAVLINIESAYNYRRADRYENVLDANFTFYLSTGDVGGGLPEQWGRADEVALHERLFDPELDDPEFPLCRSIELNLDLPDDLVWVESPAPTASAEGPDEIWYTTTIFYDFVILVEPDIYFLAIPGAKTQFTVRNAATESAPRWQLVEMRDVGAQYLTTSRRMMSRTQESTWGGVKGVYW